MTQELRRLAEAATQGTWIAGDDEDSDYFLVGPHDGDEIVFQPVVKLHAQNNAEFIAAANPAAILALLDRLEKAEQDAECFLLWVHEAWHSPSDIMKLLNNCETPEDYRAKLLPIIAAKKAAITGAMEASK